MSANEQALEKEDRRQSAWASEPVHSRLVMQFELEPKYMAKSIASMGESLNADQVQGLYRIGHEGAIKQLLWDALVNELESGV